LQPSVPLIEENRLFRIEIKIATFCFCEVERKSARAIFLPTLESQIMDDSEEPTLQIVARTLLHKMPEEREKRLLHDVFAILQGDTKTQSVAEQPCPHEIEEFEHLVFEQSIPARLFPRRSVEE